MTATDASKPKEKAPKLDTTVVKGFAVLDALSKSDTPLGISTLSTQLSLGKSNVHRLLNTLSALGFVRQEEGTKRYMPTLRAWEIGSMVVDRNMLRRAALPIMRRMREEYGETIYLATLTGSDVLYLEALEGIGGLRSGSRAGLRVSAVLPASGKLLLGLQPDTEALVESALATLPPEHQSDRAALLAEIAEIAEAGYAVSLGGLTQGVNAIAVPIVVNSQPPVATMGFAVPSEKWNKRLVSTYFGRLKRGAADIAAVLRGD